MGSSFNDNVVSQGLTGLQARPDASLGPLRLSKSGATVVTDAHAQFYEAAARSKLFIASIGVAGVAPGTALSTTPAFILWNPVASGVLVSIQQVFVAYVSGTLGAGMLVHAQNTSQLTAPSSGTELAPLQANLGGGRGSARCFTGSTISATSTLLRPSMTIGAALASTAAFTAVSMDNVQGGIVVPPGVAYCFQGIAAAGTSPLVSISVTYEEVAIS